MKPQNLIALLLLTATCLFMSPAVSTEAAHHKKSKRPNIVWIFVEGGMALAGIGPWSS